ncbi:PQQ-binding-like beta-propeller repeat protein [Niabella beijingensis]|uniref:outer membrane protein assembly factor BamB family protein n=1 Tax=Niabella beijingensis TaxID=2872700 RepID=UPI001CBC81A9|nr:PQQ-binding-like beta-propeller repeat protein [Niabella beijingensis]MBZ4187987.1 PQQ-binding-like beta-propeller repeat protein [Niabella beijingensis]
MKRILFIGLYCFFVKLAAAQPSFQFAQISDLHIGSHDADEDLRRTVRDINANPDIRFVIASGDITEFGADTEIQLARQLLDSLNKPWYIVPGNHDDNWSESGTNTFNRIFGNEVFAFSYEGIHFLGANCGPNMKMSPGQVPYGNIVWLDSVLATIPAREPIIFVDHYPLDSSLNNWYEIADRLKRHNIQLYMCGHGHQNRQYDFEGIPGVMGRSNLRAKDSIGGYNIITIENGRATYRERKPGRETKKEWAVVELKDHHLDTDTQKWFRPSYAVNQQYPQVKEVWRYQDSSDIGNGFVLYKNRILTPDSRGRVLAIDPAANRVVWRFVTGGKIYAAPAIEKNRLVIPSTDGTIYCLNADNGKLLWSTATEKSIVATPVIKEGTVFVGSSEGKFRALRLSDGKLIWHYDSVRNFVKATPLYTDGKLIFGSWGNQLYALNSKTGKAEWVFTDGYGNRMLSPASCLPVTAFGRIFIVAPDRYMSALDAATGRLIWKHRWNEHSVRESMGLSADKKLVFAKTMQGHLVGIDTKADSAVIVWKTGNVFNYELNPSKITERNGRVYAFSDKGVIAAFDRKTGATVWVHKVANCLIHDLQFINDRKIAVTTMDGKVVLLQINN